MTLTMIDAKKRAAAEGREEASALFETPAFFFPLLRNYLNSEQEVFLFTVGVLNLGGSNQLSRHHFSYVVFEAFSPPCRRN